MATPFDFVPALLVVDMQEDFCGPNGSLAIPHGRSLAPLINDLLTLPFVLKVATQDWHPPNSITFASQHPHATPFTSTATLTHPSDPGITVLQTLWPDHCIQDTKGAELIPELDAHKLDLVVRKGMDAQSEMYSGFKDCFGRKKHDAMLDMNLDGAQGSAIEQTQMVSEDLAACLHAKGIKQVFTVGLAGDVCVKCTALDAVAEGFETYWVEDVTAGVSDESIEAGKQEMRENGIRVIKSDDQAIRRVRELVNGTRR